MQYVYTLPSLSKANKAKLAKEYSYPNARKKAMINKLKYFII